MQQSSKTIVFEVIILLSILHNHNFSIMKTPTFLFLILAFIFRLHAQPIPMQLGPDTDQDNNIRNYLMRTAAEITDKSLTGFRALDDWEKVRQDRYNQFVEMMSLQDTPLSGERPPLNVKITGTVRMKGYRIEKLSYESLPGLYVVANLYIPDKIKKPTAAILYQCGHSQTQKGHYQSHPRKFAQLGFVCLIVETIQFGEVWGDHHGCYAKGWFQWYSRGYTPGGVEVWNAIRGIDLLAARPEVDPEKIGVTGISGGGAMSWFIAAIDPRIKAAAPVCGNSTLKSHILTRTVDGHCDCMFPVNTYRWDMQDIGALIAPRPLLIAQADRDGLNSLESSREVYFDLKDFYKLYGADDKISMIETPGGHSYHTTSREGIFSFFFKYLMGKDVTPEAAGDVDEMPGHQLSGDQLKVYVHGAPEDDRTTTIQDTFVRLAAPPELSGEQALKAHKDSVISFLKRETFGAFPKTPPAMKPHQVFRTADGAAYGTDIYSFISEEGWRLKVEIHWNQDPSQKNPLMIVLRSPGEKRWGSEGFISGLDKKWNVAYFEARGVGEFGWASELQWHVRRASAWTGRTIASMQVFDVLRCLQFCRTLEGVDSGKTGIAARNEMGVIALYAALLDGSINTLIIKNPPASQNTASRPDGRGPAVEMLNCLRITDLRELPALVAPATTYLIGSAPPSWQWSVKALEAAGLKELFNEIKSISEVE